MNRCAKHPEVAAVTTCRRCGTFACAQCMAGAVCVACDTKPAVHKGRVKQAAKNVAAACALFFGLAIGEGFFSIQSDGAAAVLLGSAILGLPFLVLGVVQLAVKSPVPGILGAVLALAGLGVMVVTGSIDLLTPFWAGTLVGLVSTLKTLLEKRRAWRNVERTFAGPSG